MWQQGGRQSLETGDDAEYEEAGGHHRHPVRREQPKPCGRTAGPRNGDVGQRDRRQAIQTRPHVFGDDVRGDRRAALDIREHDERTLS
jgi:hypothetical protein